MRQQLKQAKLDMKFELVKAQMEKKNAEKPIRTSSIANYENPKKHKK